MIIDLGKRIREVSSLYGLSEEEGIYLFELILYRIYDYNDDLHGLDLGGGIKAGIAFVDFVDTVRRGSYDRKKHLRSIYKKVNSLMKNVKRNNSFNYTSNRNRNLHMSGFYLYCSLLKGKIPNKLNRVKGCRLIRRG